MLARGFHDLAQVGARPREDPVAGHPQVLNAIHNDQAAESGIAYKEVAPATDQEPPHAARDRLADHPLQRALGVGFGEHVRRSPDAERGVRRDCRTALYDQLFLF